jgi:putative tryptophan/tyrosine transport system substrate-binding protein
MRRREFITLVGGVTAWPFATHAQPAKLPTIGFLGTATPSTWGQFVTAFVQRLRDLGWVEGRNVAIEFRWAEGRTERYTEIATEFVQLKVDVIVTSGGAVLATKQATSVIPIVFALALDPVGSGMVASLARPGGNITGLSIQSTDLTSKRLELLREIVPGLRRLAILGNASNPNALMEMGGVQATARSLGFVEVITPKIRRAEDIAPAVEALKGHAEALYLTPDPLIISHQIQISNLALGARLAVMSFSREFVEAGALMSYGPNNSDLFRRAAEYVDKILRGTKPGDLPVQQPTSFQLVINLKTAKALDLTVPRQIQTIADEVIE